MLRTVLHFAWKTAMTRERTTAVISSLVAVVILGAVVTAQPARTTPRDRLASLESDLRFQLDLRWRQDHGAYDERVAELESTLEAWRKSPQSENDMKLFAEWLREAIVRSLPGEPGELPATPSFGEKPTKEIVATATREKAQGPGVRSQESGGGSQDAKALGERGSDLSKPTGTHRAVMMPAHAEGAAERTPRVLARSRVEAGPLVRTQAPLEAKSQAEAAPLAKAASPLASAGPATEQSVTVHKMTVTENKGGVEKAAAPMKPVAVAAKVAKPVAAKPPLGRIFDPEAQTRRELGAERRAAKRVELNLAELNARIGGYHDGLDEVEAAIVAAKGAVSKEAATRLVGHVEELAGQYGFVRLYYEALTEDEREFVTAPRSMASTVTLVAQQCEGVEQAGGEDFLDASADDTGGELAKRLRAVADAISGDASDQEPQ
jgi:hypothetical protein